MNSSKTLFWILAAYFLSILNLHGQDKKLDVYVFLAEECPISIYMVRPLLETIERHVDFADFYAVFPNAKSTKASATTFLSQYELTGYSMILDPDLQWVRRWGATITPEAIVVEKETGEILYRGRISNAYLAPGRMKHGSRINNLRMVLNNYLAGKPTSTDWPEAVGCYITMKP